MNALGLDPRVVRAATKRGFTTPTPVQAKAIPLALEGKVRLRDADTGSASITSAACVGRFCCKQTPSLPAAGRHRPGQHGQRQDGRVPPTDAARSAQRRPRPGVAPWPCARADKGALPTGAPASEAESGAIRRSVHCLPPCCILAAHLARRRWRLRCSLYWPRRPPGCPLRPGSLLANSQHLRAQVKDEATALCAKCGDIRAGQLPHAGVANAVLASAASAAPDVLIATPGRRASPRKEQSRALACAQSPVSTRRWRQSKEAFLPTPRQGISVYPRELLQARRHHRDPPLPRHALARSTYTHTHAASLPIPLSIDKLSVNAKLTPAHTLSAAVLDEADLLLSFGYEDDLATLARRLPQRCQRMLVSATLKCGLTAGCFV